MPYEISWNQEKRIILDRLYGDHDLQSAIEGSEVASRYLNEGTEPVHMIVDMKDLKTFPTNITKVHKMTEFMKNPALGWVVVIGATTLTNFLVTVMSQLVKFRVAQRSSLEEAVAFLKQQDPTLTTEPVAEKQAAQVGPTTEAQGPVANASAP